MGENIYKVVELVGSSTESIEHAVQSAIKRASLTVRNLRWFEVLQTRGSVDNGAINYQVVIKAGFTLDEGQ